MTFLMVQGTSSGAGKTTLVAALCRIFSDMGYSVAPFKSQNMSRFVYDKDPKFIISQAQAIQAVAARKKPHSDMNPIVLKPHSTNSSTVYVKGKRHSIMNAKEYYKFAPAKGFPIAVSALKRLGKLHDVVIIEGAGSPAEINLKKYDIANMRIALAVKSPVILVTDIDRGGSFASLVGTMHLLEKKHKALVRGCIFNKFRGDASILEPGFAILKKLSSMQVLGTIPYMSTNLPQEDSLDDRANVDIQWTDLEKNMNKLARIVRKNVNISAIERMIK